MSSFPNVTVDAKANIYFDGRVVSHSLHFPDGSKKTLGLIYEGCYHFDTATPERMEIIAGECKVTLDGAPQAALYPAGSFFNVPGNSGFDIQVKNGICEYICSFLQA